MATACSCSIHQGADGHLFQQTAPDCPVHREAVGPECRCVTVLGGRMYPAHGCPRCNGTGFVPSRPQPLLGRADLAAGIR